MINMARTIVYSSKYHSLTHRTIESFYFIVRISGCRSEWNVYSAVFCLSFSHKERTNVECDKFENG